MLSKRNPNFIISVIVLAMVVGAVVPSARAEQEKLDLQMQDVLARPGDFVDLAAKLEKAGPHGIAIPAADIEFRLDGKPIGTRKTDEHGDATLRIQAPEPGDHIVKVVYAGEPRYLRSEYRALLAVRRETETILVVDVDWTLSMTDNLNTTLGGRDCPPVRDAPEALEKLATRHTVAYVTGRARQLRKRTISWLHRYGFPRGPTFFLDPGEFPTYDAVAYKKSVLAPMRQKFSGLKIGIGNDRDDLESYGAVGLKTLLIGQEPIPGAVCVRDWSQAEEALVRLESAPGPSKK